MLAAWLLAAGYFFLRVPPAEFLDEAAMRARSPALIASNLLAPGELSAMSERALANSPDADFAVALETSLVALRGYLLTGADGFKEQWLLSLAALKTSHAEMDRASQSWTDGQKILEWDKAKKDSETLIQNEAALANLIGTQNRYPGFRLYQEKTDPALAQAIAICDDTLQSILAMPMTNTTTSVGLLATLRGTLRETRSSFAAYLLLHNTKEMPATLKAQIEKLGHEASDIQAIRSLVGPEDQVRLDRLSPLISSSLVEMQRIAALRQSDRWDYADFAFREQILPGAMKTLKMARDWSKTN